MPSYIDPSPCSLIDLVARVEEALAETGLSFGHGTDNARDEAAWLVLEGLGRSPVEPVAAINEWIPCTGVAAVGELLARRVETRRPLAYLTGRAWFAGLEFAVDERALVPRSPLAEMIGERFAPWLRPGPVERILDIGTGGGCIAIACAHAFPEAVVDASDIDPAALALAWDNVARHRLDGRVVLHEADGLEGLPPRQWDLIVSNPPYVDATRMAALPAEYRHEPGTALAGGALGLDVIEGIVHGAGARLVPAGLLVIETGAAADAVVARWPSIPWVWPELWIGEAGICLAEASWLP